MPPRGGQLLLTPKTDCRLTAAVPEHMRNTLSSDQHPFCWDHEAIYCSAVVSFKGDTYVQSAVPLVQIKWFCFAGLDNFLYLYRTTWLIMAYPPKDEGIFFFLLDTENSSRVSVTQVAGKDGHQPAL